MFLTILENWDMQSYLHAHTVFIESDANSILKKATNYDAFNSFCLNTVFNS